MDTRKICILAVMLPMALALAFSSVRAEDRERVVFHNGPVELMGNLYLPPDFDRTKKCATENQSIIRISNV